MNQYSYQTNPLERFKKLCDIATHIDDHPVLHYLWNRDFDNLKIYFFLEHGRDKKNNFVLNDAARIHSKACWGQFLLFSEQLLASAFDLRIFILQHQEWFDAQMNSLTISQQQQIMEVVLGITDYIKDFTAFCQNRQRLPFWNTLFDISLKEYPYVQMYLNITTKQLK